MTRTARVNYRVGLLVCLSVLAALWPLGRLALTGFEPTLEELLRLRCGPLPAQRQIESSRAEKD
jgi:hypothetical protein